MSIDLALTSLPPEILLQIFLHLADSQGTLLALLCTCRYLNNLILGSSQLLYEAELFNTNQIDNPYLGEGRAKPSMTVAEKLEWLRETSRRWSVLDIEKETKGYHAEDGEWVEHSDLRGRRIRSIKVNHSPSGIYDLTGGIYLLGDLPRQVLHWVKLPSKDDIQDGVRSEWNKIDIEELRKRPDSDGRHRTIVDMGLCIHEHDLICIVTTSPQPTTDGTPPTMNDIDLLLLQFSTGQPHPALAKPKGTRSHYIRHVISSPKSWHRPSIGIEIVGEHLVLVLHYREASAEDLVYIWEWKTGVLKMSLNVRQHTYSGVIFLTPSLILLPNTRTNTLDIFCIPTKPTYTPVNPILCLDLPTLAEGRFLFSISCRAEPNPIASTSSSPFANAASTAIPSTSGHQTKDVTPESRKVDVTPTRPFLPNAEHAICIFSLRIIGGDTDHPLGCPITMVVHRSALVDIVKREAPNFDAEGGSGAKDGGSIGNQETTGRSDRESSGAGEFPFPTPGPSTSYSYFRYSQTGGRYKAIPYSVWGPPITRWLNTDSVPTRWITTTCGQRLVLTAAVDETPSSGCPYVVWDFCQDNVRKMGEKMKAELEKEERRQDRDRRKRDKTKGKLVWRQSEPDNWSAKVGAEEEDVWMLGNENGEPYASPGDAISSSRIHVSDATTTGTCSSPSSPSAMYHELWNIREEGSGYEVDYEMDVEGHDEAAIAGTSAQPTAALTAPTSDAVNTFPQPQSSYGEEIGIRNDFSRAMEGKDDPFDFENASSTSLFQQGGQATRSSSPGEDSDINVEDEPRLPLNRLWHITSSLPLAPYDMFAERVDGNLPYVACATEKPYWFDGVLIDEERVVGITTDVLGRVSRLDVHYFG